jgi:hypothetical protein
MIQPSAFLNEDIDYNRERKVVVWQNRHTERDESHSIGKDSLYGNSNETGCLRPELAPKGGRSL